MKTIPVCHSADLSSLLKRQGIAYLLPEQEFVIRRILEEETLDQAVIFPTGFGKSLCFQLPAALLPSPTLVIYPLRALLRDQKRRLEAANLTVLVVQGGQTRSERNEVFRRLKEKRVDIVLSNPETVLVEATLRRLAEQRWSHLVIDEAHCLVTWGNDFRPAYRELPRLIAALKPARISAFTATADSEVQIAWSKELFDGRPFSIVRVDPDRPNLYYAQRSFLSLRRTLTDVAENETKPMAIFGRSREGVRTWARHLAETTSWPVRFYHAGLSTTEKGLIEDWFRSCLNGILVTTSAFGLGVDHPHIRTVVHLDRPASDADYLQQTGRAGRDGAPARVILLHRDLNPLVRTVDFPACLRRDLLEPFGGVGQDCAGCDACLGRSVPGDRAGALAALAFGHRRWTLEETRLRLFRFWKEWSGWEREEAWKALFEFGWIDFPRHGFYKGLLKVLDHDSLFSFHKKFRN